MTSLTGHSPPKYSLLMLVVSSIALSLLSIIVVGEVVCRVFFPDDHLRYAKDSEALYYYEPNQDGILELSDGVSSIPIKINDLGFRGGAIQPKGKKILVLGDSFTFGWGVRNHETFSSRLNEWFADEITVINGGQPGYGIFQMNATLRRVGPKIMPDLVIVVLWQGDLLRQPPNPEEREHFFKRQAVSRLFKSSVLLTHIYRRVEKLLVLIGQDKLVFRVGEGGKSHVVDKKEIVEQHLRGWRADEPRLISMQEQAARYGNGMLLVLWPKEDFASVAEEGLADTLTEIITEFAQDKRIPFISVQSAMRSVPKKSELLIPKDLHPTPLAHCLAAKVIAEKLQELHFVSLRPMTCEPRSEGGNKIVQ